MTRVSAPRSSARMRLAIGGACAAIFVGAAALIYFAIGSRHSLPGGDVPVAAETAMSAASAPATGETSANSSGKSMDAEVAGLEARLARDGGSADDWNLLAKAYDFLGRPADAQRARAHIAKPASGATLPLSVSQMSAGALVAAATAAEAPANATTRSAAPAQASASLSELQQRVKQNPRDAAGWLALADLERIQHDNAAARDALARVIALHAMSAQSWADYADVLASLGSGSLTGDAGKAIDSALALDAANPKALWLKASQAHELRQYREALGWWRKLRAAMPPDSPDAHIIDGNIAEDTQLAGLPQTATAAAAPAAPAAPAATGGAEVSGTVSIDSRFAARVQRDATLFIYAKAADSPGPPLAVLRTTAATWPVNFRLDDSMAMMPSRRLSQFDKVVVEARISRSGQATPSPGDLYVTSQVLRPASGTKLSLVINREIS